MGSLMSSFSLSNAIRVFVSVVVRVYHCLSLSSSSLSVLALVWSLPAQHLPARRSLTRSTKSCCRFSSSKKRKKTTKKTFAAGCSCFCFRSFATTRSKSFVGASFAVDFATTRREAAVDLVARHTQTSSSRRRRRSLSLPRVNESPLYPRRCVSSQRSSFL